MDDRIRSMPDVEYDHYGWNNDAVEEDVTEDVVVRFEDQWKSTAVSPVDPKVDSEDA